MGVEMGNSGFGLLGAVFSGSTSALALQSLPGICSINGEDENLPDGGGTLAVGDKAATAGASSFVPATPAQELATLEAGGKPATLSEAAKSAAIALTPRDIIAERLQLTIHWTRIEKYADKLGGREFIAHLKSILYARMIAMYPELRNLPPEKFVELFCFNFNLNWRLDDCPSGAIEMYYGVSNIGIETKLPVKCSEGYFSCVDITSRNANKSLLKRRVLSDANVIDTKVPQNQILDIVRWIVDSVDFTHVIKPGMMESLLSAAHPELEVYFKLDRMLQFAMQNPEALVGHLREQIEKAEVRIRDLFRRHEIDATQMRERLDALRLEEKAILKTLDERRQEVAALEDKLRDLRADIAAARKLLQELVYGPSGISIHVNDILGNVEAINLDNDEEATKKLRSFVGSHIRAMLQSRIKALVDINGENWEKTGVRIKVSMDIVSHLRTKKWWTRKDVCEVLLTADIETPSHGSQKTGQIKMIFQSGALVGDVNGDLESFISDMQAAVEGLIVDETLSPRREKMRVMLKDSDKVVPTSPLPAEREGVEVKVQTGSEIKAKP